MLGYLNKQDITFLKKVLIEYSQMIQGCDECIHTYYQILCVIDKISYLSSI